jgi:hypothetical protein
MAPRECCYSLMAITAPEVDLLGPIISFLSKTGSPNRFSSVSPRRNAS